jgi:hypothetical protein
MNRRGLTFPQLLLVLALIALLVTLVIALCVRGGPLTAQDGSDVGDQIHGDILTLIAPPSTTPVDSIAAQIGRRLRDRIDQVQDQEGVTEFTRGLCERLILLTNNRIQSTPDRVERQRLQQFLPRLIELCEEAQQSVSEPGD